MVLPDRRPNPEARRGEALTDAAHETLPPPEWTGRTPEQGSGRPGAGRLPRRSGTRADEAWLRARVEEARAAGTPEPVRATSSALARWLAARERDLDEAVELGTSALSLGDDVELRREVSAWLESLGEPSRAASILKPAASGGEVDPAEAAYVLVRVGILKARAGAAAAAASAFEAAIAFDPNDALPAELLAGLSAWQPEAVSAKSSAKAYVEAAQRRAAQGQKDAEHEDLWRALSADPSDEEVAAAVARAIGLLGRSEAADEVLRAHALAVAGGGDAFAPRIHAQRRAAALQAGESVRALASALDQALDTVLEGEDGRRFDALLLGVGMLDALAVRISLRADGAPMPAERAAHFAELGQLSLGPLSDPLRALSAYAAALAADASCDSALGGLRAILVELPQRAGDGPSDSERAPMASLDELRGDPQRVARFLEKLQPTVPRLSAFFGTAEDGTYGLAAASAAWVHASLANDTLETAIALERLSAPFAPPLRAALLCAASDHYRHVGDVIGARRTAENATVAHPDSVRAAVTLADASLGDDDRGAASAFERAIVVAGPRYSWCVALADALDALGDSEPAVAFSQRCVSMRPGDIGAVERLLDRVLRSGDAGRLADTLAWLLGQPQPLTDIATPFGRALRELIRLDSDRAVVVARRALDVFGPKSAPVREALIDAAMRAGDEAFVAAVFERRLACGAESAERRQMFGALVELYERLGDETCEARIVARAMRDGLTSPTIDAHLDRLMDRPAAPDGQLWRMEADARRKLTEADRESASRSWRELGGAFWDLADDRVNAISAWERAARMAGSGGHITLARDLVEFGDATFAFEYLGRLIDAEPDDRAAAGIAADVARAALEVGEPRVALDLAARGISRCPSWADALEVAEMSATPAGDLATLSGLYDLVALRAFGRFGRRAAHYRGARFFERHAAAEFTLKHATQAFAALPSEGSSFQLLARAAALSSDRGDAIRTVESVADSTERPERRAAWLVRAARLIGVEHAGAKRKVDILLRALVVHPSVASVAEIDAAMRPLLVGEPSCRDELAKPFAVASSVAMQSLQGPEGARVALSLAVGALDLFRDADQALTAFERAFALDADVAEFHHVVPFIAALAEASSARERTAAMIAAVEIRHVRAGVPALALLGELASAAGDAELKERATALSRARDIQRGSSDSLAWQDDTPAPSAPDAGAESDELEKWVALERDAEMSADDGARSLALENIVARVPPENRVPFIKRLALARARQGNAEATERAWRDVLALDPHDEYADQAIEEIVTEAGRFEELAEHLGRRAERLAAEPARAEALPSVRLRRAVVLEQRLGLVQEACVELERLLAESPNNAGGTAYLADLLERQGEFARAASLWTRAAATSSDADAKDELDLRAGRASRVSGDLVDALGCASRVLARSPANREALELSRDAAIALGADEELGDALERLAVSEPDAITKSGILVEAALAAARAGALELALSRASRAADVVPQRATPQLLARGFEYRLRGAGTPDEARATIDNLGKILEPMGADDIALRAFLLAEALDVVQGHAAGFRELRSVGAIAGEHPLVVLGLAERLAAQGQSAAAVKAYKSALRGAFLGLRTNSSVAMSAAGSAIRAHLPDDALYFLRIAERYEDTRSSAQAWAATLVGTEPAVAAPWVPVPAGGTPESTPDAAPENTQSALERAREQMTLGLRRIDQGDLGGAETLFRDALLHGLTEAGDSLAELLRETPDRTRDVLRVRRQQVALEPGDMARLEALASSALQDGDGVYACAVEHVLRAVDGGSSPASPPPLAAQPEQSGIFTLLTRPSSDYVGEALALLWEGAATLFTREAAGRTVPDAAGFMIPGAERVLPAASPAIARIYEIVVRALDAPRIPLFVSRSKEPPSARVALLWPPSVVLSGDMHEESGELLFALGCGMSAALPQHVLCLGLPSSEGHAVVEALRVAFAPPEVGRAVDVRAARLAESFWHIVPARTQRRIQLLLSAGSFPNYDDLVSRAAQSGRRVGMFLSGDFRLAVQSLIAEAADPFEFPTAKTLRSLCERAPLLSDLFRLAVSPEYANARWHGVVERQSRPSPPPSRFPDQ